MDALIRNLLDLAALEAGRLTLERTTQRIAALTRDAVEAMRPLAAARAQTLELQVPDEGLCALCDRERVLQVFSNLLGNAIKFSPMGTTIRVGAAAEGARARLWVSDAGPGIDRAQLRVIFAPFWRGSQRAQGGVGLGLWIARDIVEAHGGRIWVESRVGEGATFLFTLPLTKD